MLITKGVWCCRIRPRVQIWTTWRMEAASFSEPTALYRRRLDVISTAAKTSNLACLLSKERS